MKKVLAYILSLCLLFTVQVYAETTDLPFASVPDTPPGRPAALRTLSISYGMIGLNLNRIIA